MTQFPLLVVILALLAAIAVAMPILVHSRWRRRFRRARAGSTGRALARVEAHRARVADSLR